MPRKRLSPPPKDAQTGKPLPNKGPESTSILTVNGRLVLSRRRYGGGVHPLDDWLDSAQASISPGLRELACRLNQGSRSFEKAAENLTRAAQVGISDESLRQVVEAEGRAVLAAQKSGRLTLSWTAGECRLTDEQGQSTGTTRVYLGCDGVRVAQVTQKEKQARRAKVKQKRRRRGRKCRALPRARPGADQRYKEFRIVTYYDQEQEHRHISVSRGGHEAVGELMRRDAGRIRLDEADDKVAVIDGAPWIAGEIRGQSLPIDAVGLDFYHLAENVHKARRKVYGEQDEGGQDTRGQDWAAEVLHTAKHEGYQALEARLRSWRSSLRGKRRKAAEQLLGYVSERSEMIAYPEYLALGRQIGSGPTESMCRATTERLKGVGMRWDGDNAEGLMALEALDQSGQWQRYWATVREPAA